MDQSLQRSCLHCGASIEHLSAQAKYCSGSHRTAAWMQADRLRNPDKYKARDQAQAIKYAERKRRATADWIKRNPERHRANVERHKERNPGRNSATLKLAQMRKRKHAPSWLSQEQIKEILGFYATAQMLTRDTGIKHEVDHIEPLNGAISCGLHVPWNLQVLTKKENRAKRNSLPG